jgi:autotransporter-associated beta strand protein
VLFAENAALTGYDKLVNDFYYNGFPGSLTFNSLTIGESYQVVLYTKVGHWAGRPQNATFDEDGFGPAFTQLLNTDPGAVGYYAYNFVAPTNALTIDMAPIIPATFHWFAASLERVNAATPTLTVGDAGSYVFSGAVEGPTGLVKQGTGVQELSGPSTYSGPTVINGGRLVVNGSLSGTSAVTITAGALAGTGSINPVANVTVAAGGEIAPGVGIGTLTTGPVAFANGSILSIEVGTTAADRLLLDGAGSLAGTVTLSLSLLANPVDNTVFTLLDGTAPLIGYALGGRFQFGANLLDEGELFTVTTGAFSQPFQISYLADGGNDVTLLAVPEPGSVTLLLVGATAFARLRRRRS